MQAARTAFPNAKILLDGCKPVAEIDGVFDCKRGSCAGQTKGHKTKSALLQTAFDSQLVSSGVGADGFFDVLHILRGLEFLAPDTKHYRKEGAFLYFNALLTRILELG